MSECRWHERSLLLYLRLVGLPGRGYNLPRWETSANQGFNYLQPEPPACSRYHHRGALFPFHETVHCPCCRKLIWCCVLTCCGKHIVSFPVTKNWVMPSLLPLLLALARSAYLVTPPPHLEGVAYVLNVVLFAALEEKHSELETLPRTVKTVRSSLT